MTGSAFNSCIVNRESRFANRARRVVLERSPDRRERTEGMPGISHWWICITGKSTRHQDDAFCNLNVFSCLCLKFYFVDCVSFCKILNVCMCVITRLIYNIIYYIYVLIYNFIYAVLYIASLLCTYGEADKIVYYFNENIYIDYI